VSGFWSVSTETSSGTSPPSLRHQLESGLTVAQKPTPPEKPGNPGELEISSAVMSVEDPPSPSGSENEIVESAPAAPTRSTAPVAQAAKAAETRLSRSRGDLTVAMWQL
jgi:hypothetical protein